MKGISCMHHRGRRARGPELKDLGRDVLTTTVGSQLVQGFGV